MLLGTIFLNIELSKPHFSHDKMTLIHRSLHIKQNIYSKGIFRAPFMTQFIAKVQIKIKKVPFLIVYHFSISQHFAKVVQAVIA